MGLGTPQTRAFYDSVGWSRVSGRLMDQHLFGGHDNSGPIQAAMHARREARIREMIGRPAVLLECGCGGNPAVFLSDLCGHFIASDFSALGLAEADMALAGVSHETVHADMTDLPIADCSVDAVYAAQCIYHIANVDGQRAAIREMLRVLKPGGIAVFLLANPFPILFPGRILRRLLAMTPGVSTLLNKLRRKPPVPYLPLSIHWTYQELRKYGIAQVDGYSLASTWFKQHIPERGIGRWLWKIIAAIETYCPHAAAYLGCYTIASVRKSATLTSAQSPALRRA